MTVLKRPDWGNTRIRGLWLAAEVELVCVYPPTNFTEEKNTLYLSGSKTISSIFMPISPQKQSNPDSIF